MLQVDDDNDLKMMVTEDDIVFENSQTVEMFRLELPTDTHAADDQLNYNSEMISINEFESRAEEDDREEEQKIVVEKEEQSQMITCDNVDVSSEDNQVDASPILQF